MKEKHFEFICFRSFGFDCPVAVVQSRDGHNIYTLDGLLSLKEQYNENDDTSLYLEDIISRMARLKIQDLPELSDDDISGQQNLF